MLKLLIGNIKAMMNGLPSTLWVEKYRPQKLDEIIGQEEIIKRLKAFLTKGLPHLLFAGPPGCGKTTAAIAIAHELYGSNWHANYLELNASDERGIDVVRHKIKDFARTKPIAAQYKIICLDEGDSLTNEAQHALRRTMERYSETTRFIIIANYSSKIIDPIQSRCAIFRFKPLQQEIAVKQLQAIAQKENLKVDSEAVNIIMHLAQNDMRRAINILQSTAASGNITEQSVYETTAAAPPKVVSEMLQFALIGNFTASRSLLLKLIDTGIPGEEILKEIGKQAFMLQMPDIKKVSLIEKVGEYEYRIASGGSPQIQIEALLAQLALMK